MEFKGNLPSGQKSLTDWERVKKNIAEDAPIPYDPEDGPYDPNDEAASEAYINQATIYVGWPNPVMVQKDGIRVNPDESPVAEADKTRAKAS
jgi:hypothetical protein